MLIADRRSITSLVLRSLRPVRRPMLPRMGMTIIAALLAGCASRPGPPPDPNAVIYHWGQVPPPSTLALAKSGPNALTPLGERLAAQFAEASTGPQTRKGFDSLDLLILSGGGSHGAFGAGLLAGWTETGKRPEFDVVTGVSTGALMATHAFLGSEWDADMERLYTTITNDDIFRPRTRLFRLFSDALNDTAPLERTLEREITAEMLDAVAAEHRRGRQLYVASTDLDANDLAIWDLGRIAASDRPLDERLTAYRRALLASAAIPVFFPPVYIEVDGGSGQPQYRMHVDGGAKGPIFFRDFMTALRQALLAAGLIPNPGSDTIWLIVNGRLTLDATAPEVAPNLLSVAGRSIEIVYSGQTFGHVYRIYTRADKLGYRFRLAAIPESFDLFPAKDFIPEDMTRLFDAGRSAGRDGGRWMQHPPDLDPSERVQ